MPDFFDLKNAINTGPMDLPHLGTLFARMALAAFLGGFIAFRIWRRLLPSTARPSLQGAQSQTLIAAAGALMVVVIGDNVARAFGLVGLGAFIRFRSGISDPRDAAIMFVMIGIGMACGLGLPLMAIGATLFVCITLIVFDLGARGRARRTLVTLVADDPPLVWSHVATLFPGARVMEISKKELELGKDSGKLVVEMDLRGNMDASTIRELLDKKGVPGVSRVALSE
jgi:hypothetical protein